jgi:hypothetical protein
MNIPNDQFKNVTPAQKIYILSILIDKVLQNPRDYGLNADGSLRVGDIVDFTKLFENPKR